MHRMTIYSGLTLIAIGLIMAALAVADGGGEPGKAEPCSLTRPTSVAEFAQKARAAYHPKRYKKAPTRGSKKRLSNLRQCAAPGTRGKMRSIEKRQAGKLADYRLYRRVATVRCDFGPGGHPRPGDGRYYAIDCGTVGCESGGSFRARNRVSTAGGAYQIIDSTWYAYGGSRNGDSHPAAAAPPLEQHVVGNRIEGDQWVC